MPGSKTAISFAFSVPSPTSATSTPAEPPQLKNAAMKTAMDSPGRPSGSMINPRNLPITLSAPETFRMWMMTNAISTFGMVFFTAMSQPFLAPSTNTSVISLFSVISYSSSSLTNFLT